MNDSDLIDLIVSHWKKHFTGISASHIADVSSVPHEDVVAKLRELEKRGVVHLRETRLGRVSLVDIQESVNGFAPVPAQGEMIDTVIAFPERPLLERVFKEDGADHGVFTNRLHKGDSQVRHYYFKRDVLDKYFKFKDRFNVRDDSLGGNVTTRSDYYLSLPEDQRDKETFAQVRYGNFRMADGTHGIGVIVKDLDGLPKKEQQYWASFEIDVPVLAADDSTWHSYIRESLDGSWDETHTDSIALLSEALAKINTRIGNGLFRSTSNARLHHVVLDSVGDYVAGHKELYKLIGPDNLNRGVLEGELTRLGVSNDEMINESGRQKGPWALFRMLCERTGVDFSIFGSIHTNRQRDAHDHKELARDNDYYPEKWQSDVKVLLGELEKLK